VTGRPNFVNNDASPNGTTCDLTRDILRYRPGAFLLRDAMRAAGWPGYASVNLDARLEDVGQAELREQ
jgi:hypothetical protein